MSFPLHRNIFLTGFMATGKSRIGQLTSASLGRPYYDTDKLVEDRTGKTIPDLFAEQGEPAFRALEVEALKSLADKGPYVCSLGGGTLLSPEARSFVQEQGVIVNLWADPDTILHRVNRKKDSRPLLAGLDDSAKLEKIKSLLAERKPLYDLADFHFESAEDIPHHLLTRRIIHRLQIEELNPLWVELGERRYPIYIENDLSHHVDAIAEKMASASRFLVVTDQNVKQHQPDHIAHYQVALHACPVFSFKAGESEKSLRSINKLLTFMLRHGYSRKTILVAVSGGVVGDMTGFAASIYMRGIDFIQAPTTLLSMVDSSVGGKTGINHPLGKNLIGTFWQPRAVLISTGTLRTLPAEEYLAGLAEIAKYAVIKDPAFFQYLLENAVKIANRDPEILKYLIRRSCEIKAEVVGQDERELTEGGRAILNYGHTFSHALEVLAGYGVLTHGLGVALGMRCAARLAKLLGMIDDTVELAQAHLLDALGLPKFFSGPLDLEAAYATMGLDKKASNGKRVFILPTRIGEVISVRNPDKALVLKALEVVRSPT